MAYTNAEKQKRYRDRQKALLPDQHVLKLNQEQFEHLVHLVECELVASCGFQTWDLLNAICPDRG